MVKRLFKRNKKIDVIQILQDINKKETHEVLH